MPRIILGWLLLVHGIAHASAGVWSTSRRSIWPLTIVWAVSSVAYLCAGLGLLRAPLFRKWWKPAVTVATAASMLMLAGYSPHWGVAGFAIDLALWVAAIGVYQPRFDADIAVVDALGSDSFRHPRWVRAGWTIGIAAVVYSTAVILMRPVSLRWGTTAEERVAMLPGDDVLPADADYHIDHAITIRAPASAVWPWVVQLGQDRGGFYSYDWLERLVGDRIRNADRIHPEWQHRVVGDTIFATQRDYLGGRFGALGWRVTTVEPNRVIGLENWGTFVLRPINSVTTRLIVRTRGAGTPSAAAFFFAPIDVFVFEPAHVLMERGMLRGIRDRAERAANSR